MAPEKKFSFLIEEFSQAFQFLLMQGHAGFECSGQTLEILRQWGSAPIPASEGLEEIRADLGDCRRCRLADGRQQIVFGAGNPKARLMFVGDGPGYEEDRKGEPFVGPAGQLLTKIIQAINFKRSRVYICNVIKCRPPGNRNPAPDEIEACVPFLQRQIAAIKPDYICALGTFAARTLLTSREPVARLRGRLHSVGGIEILVTYHPAYLLRNVEKKRDVWEDMQLLMQAMENAK